MLLSFCSPQGASNNSPIIGSNRAHRVWANQPPPSRLWALAREYTMRQCCEYDQTVIGRIWSRECARVTSSFNKLYALHQCIRHTHTSYGTWPNGVVILAIRCELGTVTGSVYLSIGRWNAKQKKRNKNKERYDAKRKTRMRKSAEKITQANKNRIDHIIIIIFYCVCSIWIKVSTHSGILDMCRLCIVNKPKQCVPFLIFFFLFSFLFSFFARASSTAVRAHELIWSIMDEHHWISSP